MISLKKNILAFIFILFISPINAQEYSSIVDTKIGSNSIIEHHVHIGKNCIIGHDVHIKNSIIV